MGSLQSELQKLVERNNQKVREDKKAEKNARYIDRMARPDGLNGYETR